ncbi:DUF7064 domain-containing protein [Patulibacter minatonensis]|uniref:DUF7064 domain-containing protein n=1 Tax=Patulibacter minatonensis TaxID=298163 RepID=UPI00047D4C8D|nr:hypothetical protein [Patulibacter minatonensis]
MITNDDTRFHTPDDVAHDWAETYYFDILIPEAGLHGFVYFVMRAGVGAAVCDVQFVDRNSASPHAARYVDVQHHLPLPERLESFSLPNGASLEARSATEYRVDYVGVDDTEVHLDYTGLMVPYDIHDPEIDPLAPPLREDAIKNSGFGTAYANHFDLASRATGHVIVRGQRYEVDAPVTMDHSWGPRPERAMAPMTWINANFEDGLLMHGIWKFTPGEPGTEHEFAHGYAVVDGTTHGGVGGSMRVERDGLLGRTFEMTIQDRDGTDHHITGAPVTNQIWFAYGCCPAAVAMVEWRTGDGRVGYGTSMESFPLDRFTGGNLPAAIALTHEAAR